jgi:hypothetical protein
LVVRKGQEGTLSVVKKRTGRKKRKGQEGRKEKDRTGRKKPREQLVARNGQEGRNQGNSRW